MVDDLAVDIDDDQLARSDLDDRGDVLVDVVLGEGDPFAEQGELTVGSDVSDDLDAAFGGQPFGRLVAGRQAAG